MREELPVSAFPSKISKNSKSDILGRCDHVRLHYTAQVFNVQEWIKNCLKE